MCTNSLVWALSCIIFNWIHLPLILPSFQDNFVKKSFKLSTAILKRNCMLCSEVFKTLRLKYRIKYRYTVIYVDTVCNGENYFFSGSVVSIVKTTVDICFSELSYDENIHKCLFKSLMREYATQMLRNDW